MTAAPGELFATPTPAATASGIPGRPHPSTASDAALTGDTYDWLTNLLPESDPPTCEHCSTAMMLPPAAPVLWTCPTCHPEEAAA